MERNDFDERILKVLNMILDSKISIRELIVECRNNKEQMDSIKELIESYEPVYKSLLDEFDNPDDIDLTEYS